jgi:hypothetical protein
VATNDKDSLPDDSFFEQLMKMQGTRIEDQRSSLPGKETLCTSVADSASDPDLHSNETLCRSVADSCFGSGSAPVQIRIQLREIYGKSV